MTVKIYRDLEQGSESWMAVRTGRLTASEMKLIVTPTGKVASNDKERAHLYELVAQRITGYTEPQYISDDMLRGKEEEILARIKYNDQYATIEEVGFITNDQWGFTIGYSPDGLVGDDGIIEIKSRRQKYQAETIISGVMPEEYELQVQTGLLVSGRAWCDFISYCGGMPMVTIRVYPDTEKQQAIINAATIFEGKISAKIAEYNEKLNSNARLIPTERVIEQEIVI